ncbi:hypothetical protein BC938DRAFT_481687 [Jimgerdemannia flammicorona]|uniref:Pentacotripeptide-repeat region of PRORP domain-containing protein n=1 Tax=Jimgerdemannia flammicorona TaxID=994334 RepID=A0A433QFN6_9FUNG|nr:hypothetical protein BC938DRAFT_481687 [Jimgerdemannia flammicorona]
MPPSTCTLAAFGHSARFQAWAPLIMNMACSNSSRLCVVPKPIWSPLTLRYHSSRAKPNAAQAASDGPAVPTKKPTSPLPLVPTTNTEPPRTPLIATPYTDNIALNSTLATVDHATLISAYTHFISETSPTKIPPSHLSTPHNFTTFMRAFVRRRDLPSVARVLEDMWVRGLEPTRHTYSVLLIAYAIVPDPEAALAVLDFMHEAGGKLKPEAPAYNLVMKAYFAAGNFEKAMSIYSRMTKAGCVPTEHTLKVIERGMAKKEMRERLRMGGTDGRDEKVGGSRGVGGKGW